MKIVGAVLGFLILAGVFVLWTRMYKSIKGDSGSLAGMDLPKKSRDGKPSLEDFIAAYKRGEVPIDAPAAAPAKPAATAVPARAADPAAIAAATAAPVKHDAFVSGATKLAFLACKAGLRDHHVFAHVHLQAISSSPVDPALARSAVHLLICNAALAPVAAIDMIEGAAPPDAGKQEHFKALGIRYLRFSPKSLPRPDDVRAMIYKM